MNELKKQIESILFIASRVVSVDELAKLFDVGAKDIKEAMESLRNDYSDRGVQIMERDNKFQLVTSSHNSEIVRRFMKYDLNQDLSQPALETLTIIAYKGPIGKLEIEGIRGINCSLVIRNLLLKGLIEIISHKKEDEDFYQVTFDFLRFLGINNTEELP